MGKVNIFKEDLVPLVEQGLTERKIAETLGYSVMSIRKAMRKMGLKTQRAQEKRKCIVCGAQLSGRQFYYCSAKCKGTTRKNYKSTTGHAVTERGKRKKLQILLEKGCRCSKCGYDKNMTALCFHHVNADEKSFDLDVRNFAAFNIDRLREEANKCIILCHNCHMELHHADGNIEQLQKTFNL